MKKILFVLAILMPFKTIAQTTFPINKPLYLTPDKIFTQKYNNTRASYDSIVVNYGLTDGVNAFYGSSYCIVAGNAMSPGDIVYYQPSSGSFGTMNSIMLASYTSNPFVLYPYGYDKIEVNILLDSKLNKSDTIIYLRKAGASSLYQLKGSYLTSESDASVPSYAKSLTAFSVIKTSTDALYGTLAQVAAKYTIPTGTTSQYLRGDGTVATFPTIPSAQINSDWNSVSGFSQVLNKPTIYSFTGSSAQYTKGDGTYGTLPSSKRQETYSGTTIAAGTYTVTFGTAYSVAPNIQANIINVTDSQNIRTTSITTTGFTVLVRNRVDVVGLLPTWGNVSGATVDILISEK